MTITRPFSGIYTQQAAGTGDISTANLIAFWRMNEGTGTAVSSTTGTHQGTTVNTPTWVTGKSGTGLSFNGTTQYVNVTYAAGLDLTTSAVSMMAWINATSTTGHRTIFTLPANESTWADKYQLQVENNTISFVVSAAAELITSATFTTTGSWVHVAGVYNGTDMRIYINGSLSNTPLSQTGNIIARTNGDLCIGRYGPTQGFYFNGILDDVRLYSRAVTAGEVSTVYGLG